MLFEACCISSKFTYFLRVAVSCLTLLFLHSTYLSAQGIEIESISISPSSRITANQQITFTAKITGGRSPFQYEWKFSDGFSSATSQNTLIRTVATPGNYSLDLRVTDSSGDSALKPETFIVVNSNPSLLNSKSSSKLQVDERSKTIYVANSDSNTVTAVATDSLSIRYEANVGKRPSGIALDKSRNLWVICKDDDTLHIIEGPTGRKINTLKLPYGSSPAGILASSAENSVYVSGEGSGLLYEIDTGSFEIKRKLLLGPDVFTLAFAPDEKSIYVSRKISQVSSGRVWHVDITLFRIAKEIVFPIDTTSTDSTSEARGVPNYLIATAVNPQTLDLYVGGKKDNIVAGLFRDPLDINSDSTVRAFIGKAENGNTLGSGIIDENDHGLVSTLQFVNGGNHLLANYLTNNQLIIYDPATSSVLVRLKTGFAPESVAIDYTTKRIFTLNLTARTLSVFDATRFIDSGSPTIPLLSEVKVVSKEIMTPSQVLGKQIFYDASDKRMAKDGYISCATCHLEGDQDGRVWDFTGRGEGLRNTTSLRGQRGDQRGKVHWSGNFDEIQDFELDIRKAFLGTGFMQTDVYEQITSAGKNPLGEKMKGKSRELDALADYVNSLNVFDRSSSKNSDGSHTTQGLQGAKLFFGLKCNSCHTGEFFSDSNTGKRHDVGTIKSGSGKRLGEKLDGFDTPSLIGLSRTAPYFHDGSAETLNDVFTTASSGGTHDIRSKANKGVIDLLVTFLEELDTTDSDKNGNGVSDLKELADKSGVIDTDNDQLDDAWELFYFGSLIKTAGEDSDSDGKNNLEEFKNGTDPTSNNPGSSGGTTISKTELIKKLLEYLIKLIQQLATQNRASGSVRYMSQQFSLGRLRSQIVTTRNALKRQNILSRPIAHRHTSINIKNGKQVVSTKRLVKILRTFMKTNKHLMKDSQSNKFEQVIKTFENIN
jgi:large repetitive protein